MNIFFSENEDRMRAGWRVPVQFFLMYFIAILIVIFASLFISINSNLVTIGATAIGAIISIKLATTGLDKRRWSDFGVPVDQKGLKQCILGFMLAGVSMAIIFAIEYMAGWLTFTGFGWQQQIPNSSYLYSFFAFLGLMIVVGFYEELVFRGYQIVNISEGLHLPRTNKRQAVIGAVIISSLLFGIAHIFNPNAGWISTLNVALAGAMLAFPFIITGTLGLSIGLHIGWNFFQGGVFGFPVSGMPSRSSVLQINQHGPDLITGGAFGPEAGLLGIVGYVLIILGLCWYFKKTGHPLTISTGLATYTPASRHEPA